MSDDRESLLAAVAARPDDDLPRLVFADWLDDHGSGEADSARAAFIRAQVAEWRDPCLWGLQPAGFDSHPDTWHTRPPRERLSKRIEAAHRDAWLADVPEKQRPWLRFERGFLEKLRPVKVRSGFLPLLEKPRGELTTVTRLELPAGNGLRDRDIVKVARSRGLAQLREVAVKEHCRAESLAALAAAPHAGRLESLLCDGNVYEPWRVLTAERPAPLRRLTLTGPQWSPEDMRTRVEPGDIAGAPLLRELVELELRGHGPYAPGALEAVFSAANLPTLERLRLECYDRPAIRSALAAADLPRLRRLRIASTLPEPYDALADALAGNRDLPRLEGVSFEYSSMTLDAFARLVESPALAGLKRLDAVIQGDERPLYRYLLGSDAASRFEKLCVGPLWCPTPWAADLVAKFGPRLSVHTERELDWNLRRLGQS